MLSFFMYLLFTTAFVFAGAAFIKIAHISIQPMQWADAVFGYQKMLNRLYDSPKKLYNTLLFKILGGCEVCFAHFLAVLWFVGYVVCSTAILDYWVTDEVHHAWQTIIVNIVWYLLVVCSTSILGLYFITKLFEKK
jgi:hypothetical protein